MAAVELADAQECLGELIDRVASGETIEIVRNGQLVAQLAPPKSEAAFEKKGRPKQPIDFDRLGKLWALMPEQTEDADTFMRRLRDDERY